MLDLFPNKQHAIILSIVAQRPHIEVWWLDHNDVWMFYDPIEDVCFDYDELFGCYQPWVSFITEQPYGIRMLQQIGYEKIGLFNNGEAKDE